MDAIDSQGDVPEDTEYPHWISKRAEPGTGGALPPGFPYIIDANSGEICQVGLLYIVDGHLGRDGKTFNENTVSAYTSDLLDWLRFGARFAIPWNKATWDDLGNYVDSMEGELVSPHHGRDYDEDTVSRRLVPILGLYEWALDNFEQIAADRPLGSLFESKRVASFLDARRKLLRNRVAVRKDSMEDAELPRVMQPSEVKKVLEAIGPPPREPSSPEDEASAESSVAHLGADIGLQAGLRVSEVTGLHLSLFQRFLDTEILPTAQYRVGPFRRKGGKRKFVNFHGVLLQKVVNYIKRERAFVMQGVKDHGMLLVHKRGHFRRLPIHKSTLQRRLSSACVAAELTRSVVRLRPVNGSWANKTADTQVRASFKFHDLRHTFAVWMYYARKASGDSEPWKYIQEQLGHEDVLTTIKTYLGVTQDFEAFVTDKFIDTLNWTAGLRGAKAEPL